MDDVDDFDEEGGGAGGGVEDLDEGFVRGDGALFARLVGEGREPQRVIRRFRRWTQISRNVLFPICGNLRNLRMNPPDHFSPSSRVGEAGVVALDEVGEGEFAVGVFAGGGDEKEVARLPRGALGFTGGGALFENEMPQDAAQDGDGGGVGGETLAGEVASDPDGEAGGVGPVQSADLGPVHRGKVRPRDIDALAGGALSIVLL